MKKQYGLTIPELMIAIAIFAILVSVAVPQFNNLMRRQELNSKVSLLKSTLAYARNEAISRRKDVVICGTTDGETCADSADWSSGWLVFVDEDTDNVFDTDDLLVRSSAWKSNKSKLLISSTADPKVVHYNERGESDGGVQAMMVCRADTDDDDGDEYMRTFSISNVGSVRVVKGVITEEVDGEAVPVIDCN